jgi:hypothetical protein
MTSRYVVLWNCDMMPELEKLTQIFVGVFDRDATHRDPAAVSAARLRAYAESG